MTYTPDDNYVGKDTFTYVVTSGGVSESTTVTVNVTPVNDKPESEDFTHVADDQLTHVVFDTDTKPLGSGDSKDHIADVEDDLKATIYMSGLLNCQHQVRCSLKIVTVSCTKLRK